MKDNTSSLIFVIVVIAIIVWAYKSENWSGKAQASEPSSTVQHEPNSQRFVPIPRESNLTGVPWSGAFALDTKTGQLCQTYSIDNPSWSSLPKCSDLFMAKDDTDDPFAKFGGHRITSSPSQPR